MTPSEHAGSRVSLCGTFVVEVDGQRVDGELRGQLRLLFAFLVLHRSRTIVRSELVDALWPADPPVSPNDALNTLLSRLRKVLGSSILVGRTELRLALPPGTAVDVETALAETQNAERTLRRGAWEEAATAAEHALDVSEHDFLPNADAPWAEDERRRLEEVRLRALECVAACGLGAGGAQVSATERAARRLIESAPYRETGYRFLMQALAERGRIADALMVFDEVRRLLQADIGVPPSAGLRALHEQLLSEKGFAARGAGDPLAVGAGTLPLAPAPALRARDGEHFVGREDEVERLWAIYQQARRGMRRLVFVRGEPGIGKTRLAAELCRRAHADGAAVLYGRCDEQPLVPHQPFVEALTHYVGACPQAELARTVGLGGGELLRLVPELAERLPELAPPLHGDPDGARYRLFEAVAGLLGEAGATRPVVLVLDDLHWADQPTLLLLRHVARRPHPTALLVVATYRDAEVGPGHPLGAAVADVARDWGSTRLSLGALDLAGVRELVAVHQGRDEIELAMVLFEETEGNPFFVVEMLRHLAESHDGTPLDPRLAELGIPDGVREVIDRRIDRLGPRARTVLTLASVSGRNFELTELEHMSDIAAAELAETLEEAVAARVVEELAGAAGSYTFSHALIRQTIYARLSNTRRALLHRRAATSLEDIHGADLDAACAKLAQHFTAAGSTADLAKAIEYGTRAGDHAIEQLAWEQAAAHYRHAADLTAAADDPGRHTILCDLVLAQGDAERQAGDPAHRETLFAAAALARELGDAQRLARAALANNRGFFSTVAGIDGPRVALLKDALRAHGGRDSAVHANLLAQLAVELTTHPDRLARARLSDQALAMARRVGDDATLARTLTQRYIALWGPRTATERLANTREASRLADGLDDPLLAFQSSRFGAHAAMEAGDLQLADVLLDRARAVADQLAQPVLQWYYAVTRAKRGLISGELTDAERLSRDAFELGRRLQQPDASLWLLLQQFVAALLRGTLASFPATYPLEREPIAIGADAQRTRAVPLLVSALRAATACEGGHDRDGQAHFDVLMGEELADLPDDWLALATPTVATIACVRLRDVRRARRLHELLAPFAGRFIDFGPCWFGSIDHHLANLDAMLGRREDATAQFEDAERAYARLDATAWLTRVRLDRARSLDAR